MLKKPPDYDADTCCWLISGDVAKFVSKENITKTLPEIWEVSDEKLVRNEDLRVPVSYERVKKGVVVLVEYTILTYSG
jgi:hypothetical protein